MVKTLFLVLITTALINNVVLSQFLGICPFIGVSKTQKLLPVWAEQLFS